MSSCRFIADWLFNVPRDYQLLDRLGSQIFHSRTLSLSLWQSIDDWLHDYLAIKANSGAAIAIELTVKND